MDDFVDSFRDHGFIYWKYKKAQSDADDIEWYFDEHEDDDDWEDFEDFWFDDHFENAEFSVEEELIRFKHEDT